MYYKYISVHRDGATRWCSGVILRVGYGSQSEKSANETKRKTKRKREG